MQVQLTTSAVLKKRRSFLSLTRKTSLLPAMPSLEIPSIASETHVQSVLLDSSGFSRSSYVREQKGGRQVQ